MTAVFDLGSTYAFMNISESTTELPGARTFYYGTGAIHGYDSQAWWSWNNSSYAFRLEFTRISNQSSFNIQKVPVEYTVSETPVYLANTNMGSIVGMNHGSKWLKHLFDIGSLSRRPLSRRARPQSLHFFSSAHHVSLLEQHPVARSYLFTHFV